MSETIHTPLTKLLGIRYPILLAGMNQAAGAALAAAVSNAGGCGAIGGLTLSPKMLRLELNKLKGLLKDPSLPFGVDLAIPQVGGNARKTNHDYTHGHLPELIDIIIEFKTTYFICAVGIPPDWAVEKLHKAGILIANMVGDKKHVKKALDVGVDIIIAQGTEGGGHTGEVGTMVLIGQCIDACKGRVSKLNGQPIHVVAAGGIHDGRTLAAALSLGAVGAWVGTRFVACKESAAPQRHKEAILAAEASDTLRTLVISGRPLRTYRTPYIKAWEEQPDRIRELCSGGTTPFEYDIKEAEKNGKDFDLHGAFPLLMGSCAGSIQEIKTAEQIVQDMVNGAIATMRANVHLIARL